MMLHVREMHRDLDSYIHRCREYCATLRLDAAERWMKGQLVGAERAGLERAGFQPEAIMRHCLDLYRAVLG
jgi:hypothetical protein